MRLFYAATLLIFLFILPGCATPQALITDYQRSGFWSADREYGSTSLTASRRMVIFKFKNDAGNALRVCAEPPPTVGEELSKALSAALAASVDAVKKSGTIDGSYASSLHTSLKQLEKPKGIQYEQDMLYYICQMYMNNAMQADQVVNAISDVAVRSERILFAEIGAQKTKALSESISSAVHKIKDSEVISLKIYDDELLRAYTSVDIVVRKFKPGLLENEAWAKVPNTTLSKGNISASWPSGILSLTGGELLEAALAVVPAPNAKIIYYPATSRFVYYTQNGDQASAKFSSEPIPTNVTVTLPANASVSFHGVIPPLLPLIGKFTVSDKTTEIPTSSITYEAKVDDITYRYQLAENIREQIRKGRSDGDVSIQLQFSSTYEEKPEIAVITLKQFDSPDNPTDLQGTAGIFTENVYPYKLTWKCEGKNVTHFMIDRKKDTDGTFTPVTKDLIGKDARAFEDKASGKAPYTYRITAYNQGRASKPAVCDVK